MNDEARLHDASVAIEGLLVRANPRGMARVRDALQPGYLLRAARLLLAAPAPVAIITGFPVAGTLETDGPGGARVLYETLRRAGKAPFLWVESAAARLLFRDLCGPGDNSHQPLEAALAAPRDQAMPGALIVIERPGAAADGHFYNIRGIDISEQCLAVEPLLAAYPGTVVGIGDGGNEVGMGKAAAALGALPIVPAVSGCDELIAADVSNWGGYALALLLQWLDGQPLVVPDVATLLERLVADGAVDGVSGQPVATEDGFPPAAAASLLEEIASILTTLPPLASLPPTSTPPSITGSAVS